jgi:hypothetical protein
MKKLMMIAAVGGVFALTSCKKDWTCECTTTGNGSSVSASTTVTATKKDAEAACNSSVTSGGYTTTCAIK